MSRARDCGVADLARRAAPRSLLSLVLTLKSTLHLHHERNRPRPQRVDPWHVRPASHLRLRNLLATPAFLCRSMLLTTRTSDLQPAHYHLHRPHPARARRLYTPRDSSRRRRDCSILVPYVASSPATHQLQQADRVLCTCRQHPHPWLPCWSVKRDRVGCKNGPHVCPAKS